MRSKIIYPCLRAEMARKNITIQDIAQQIGASRPTASLKLSGRYDFRLSEVLQIGELFPDAEIRFLFQKE